MLTIKSTALCISLMCMSLYGADQWGLTIAELAHQVDYLENLARTVESPSRPASPGTLRKALQQLTVPLQKYLTLSPLDTKIVFPDAPPTDPQEKIFVKTRLTEFKDRTSEIQNILDFYAANMIAPSEQELYNQLQTTFKKTLVRDSKYLKDKPANTEDRLGRIERTAYESLGLSSKKRYSLAQEDIATAAAETAARLSSTSPESRFARQAQFILSRPFMKKIYDAFLKDALQADEAVDFASTVEAETGAYELISPELSLLRIDPTSSLADMVRKAKTTVIDLYQEIMNQIAEKFS